MGYAILIRSYIRNWKEFTAHVLSKNLILPLFEHNNQIIDREDIVKCITVIVVKVSVEVVVESLDLVSNL